MFGLSNVVLTIQLVVAWICLLLFGNSIFSVSFICKKYVGTKKRVFSGSGLLKKWCVEMLKDSLKILNRLSLASSAILKNKFEHVETWLNL